MANLVRLDTAHPPVPLSGLSMRHTVGVEPVTAELRRLDPSLPADAVLAVVERTGGRFGTICTTDVRAAELGVTDLALPARAYAHAYGAEVVPAAPEAAHPSALSADQVPGRLADLAEGAECAYDAELHTGPGHAETAEEAAARVQVAREVCEGCPVRALCLAYALALRPAAGVWASFSAEEIGTLADALPKLAEVA